MGRVGAWAAALALAWAAVASAAPVTAFGPKTYRRAAGKPVAVLDTFRANPASRYTLRVLNGGNGQFPRVTNATVSLNGVQVLSPSDFRSELIEVPVGLRATNQLAVTLRSDVGSG